MKKSERSSFEHFLTNRCICKYAQLVSSEFFFTNLQVISFSKFPSWWFWIERRRSRTATNLKKLPTATGSGAWAKGQKEDAASLLPVQFWSNCHGPGSSGSVPGYNLRLEMWETRTARRWGPGPGPARGTGKQTRGRVTTLSMSPQRGRPRMLTFATKKLSESTGHGAKGQKEDAAPFRLRRFHWQWVKFIEPLTRSCHEPEDLQYGSNPWFNFWSSNHTYCRYVISYVAKILICMIRNI